MIISKSIYIWLRYAYDRGGNKYKYRVAMSMETMPPGALEMQRNMSRSVKVGRRSLYGGEKRFA